MEVMGLAEVYCIINRTIRLAEPTQKTVLQTPIAYNNTLAHCFQVIVVNDDGTDADLEGVTATAAFLRADNETVSPILGEVSGNVARVVIPASCYAVTGRFKFTMNLNKTGGYSRTAMWVEGYVEKNTSEDILDPGTPVTNIDQVIAEATAAAEAAEDAAESAEDAADAITEYLIDLDVDDGSLTDSNNGISASNSGLLYTVNRDSSFSSQLLSGTSISVLDGCVKWADRTSKTVSLKAGHRYRLSLSTDAFPYLMNPDTGEYFYYYDAIVLYLTKANGTTNIATLNANAIKAGYNNSLVVYVTEDTEAKIRLSIASSHGSGSIVYSHGYTNGHILVGLADVTHGADSINKGASYDWLDIPANSPRFAQKIFIDGIALTKAQLKVLIGIEGVATTAETETYLGIT